MGLFKKQKKAAAGGEDVASSKDKVGADLEAGLGLGFDADQDSRHSCDKVGLVGDVISYQDPELRRYRDELILRYVFRNARADGWFEDLLGEEQPRVCLRTQDDTGEHYGASFLTAPSLPPDYLQNTAHVSDDIGLVDIAGYLQCGCLLEMSNVLTRSIVEEAPADVTQVHVDATLKVQLIETYEELQNLRPSAGCAFVRFNRSLLVWHADATVISVHGRELEAQLVRAHFDGKIRFKRDEHSKVDLKSDGDRTLGLVTPLAVCISFMAIAAFVGQDVQEVVLQIKADGSYIAAAILLYWPILIWLAAFFAQTVAVIILQLFGPVSQLKTNSKYYSGAKPPRDVPIELPRYGPSSKLTALPLTIHRITIQCPVYKEGLEDVIMPAMASVQAAIQTYERQGGVANLFVNDDGIQVLPVSEARRRRDFYRRNNIAWVARPRHGDDFVRAGKFKKASNMNFALNVAIRIQDRLDTLAREGQWTTMHDGIMMQAELNDVLSGIHPRALAEGDIRLGELILLIDADTRVPADCLLDAALEFDQSPDLAILQHYSIAFQVVDNYWENCMAFFTRFVSESMRFMTAGGDVAPFIGHNAFLRTDALMQIGTEVGELRQWWSEAHVSEDFELSLKLQDLGYIVRMAAYSEGEFREGVSLTIYDEVNRWQKYAFGVSELVFHPFKLWFRRGPFTPLFRRYLRSKTPMTSKFTTLAYMGSYYAIGSQWLLAVFNFALLSWYQVQITKLFQSSFQIIIAVLVVFDVAVPVASAIYRHRTGQGNVVGALIENFKNIALLSIFFGGLSIHVSQALTWHLLSIPISWGSTSKSLENSYFLKELPMIWARFKWTYAIVGGISLVAVGLSLPLVPEPWRTQPSVFISLPLGWTLACHALAPLLLNPQSWLSEIRL